MLTLFSQNGTMSHLSKLLNELSELLNSRNWFEKFGMCRYLYKWSFIGRFIMCSNEYQQYGNDILFFPSFEAGENFRIILSKYPPNLDELWHLTC